jgi:hypothetical protein
MPYTPTAFKAYEDFKAPWEEAGEEVDAEKAKKLVYNARKAEHDAVEKAKVRAEEVKERDEALKVYKKAEEDAARVNETETDKIKRERDEALRALEEAKNAKPEKSRDTLVLEVALEHGLTKTQAARLVGETEEELAADAKQLKTELGIVDDGEPSDEEADGVTRQPRVVRTPGDPGGPKDTDIAKAVEERRKLNPLIA